MIGKILPRLILAVWVIIWAVFLIRPYFKHDLLKEYSTLIMLSDEGRRSYVLGDDLHKFLVLCTESIPGPFTYRIAGIADNSIEGRRAKYYLYPNMEVKDPDFILVYRNKGFSADGYGLFKSFDAEDYILKKTG